MFFGQFVISLILIAMGISAAFTLEETHAFKAIKTIEYNRERAEIAGKIISTFFLMELCRQAYNKESKDKLFGSPVKKDIAKSAIHEEGSNEHMLQKKSTGSQKEAVIGGFPGATGAPSSPSNLKKSGAKIQLDHLKPGVQFKDSQSALKPKLSIATRLMRSKNSSAMTLTPDQQEHLRWLRKRGNAEEFRFVRYEKIGYLKAQRMQKINFIKLTKRLREITDLMRASETDDMIQSVVVGLDMQLKYQNKQMKKIYDGFDQSLFKFVDELHVSNVLNDIRIRLRETR